MPRAAKLKVYRTPIGFHDAYVAAPSQKAAMEAWGSDKDLFSRGEAELVTDPELAAEPLARPGAVIKRLRGTAAEQIAALPPDKPRAATKVEGQQAAGAAQPKSAARPAKKAVPRPSRTALDEAERAAADADARHAAERKELADREAELARERKALEKAQAVEAAQLERERALASDAFAAAMRKWRG